MKTKLFLLLIVSACFNLFGQDTKKLDLNKYDATPLFFQMMLDGTHNFYDVKKTYEDYIITHSDDPRSFNQYKRWAYDMEERTYPTGDLPESMHVWNEMSKYKQKQKKQSKALKSTGNWVELGPGSMGVRRGHWNPGVGRINVIAKDPNNSNVIYIGTPAGGLWRSVNDGNSWTPLSDNLPLIGVSGIAIDHTNSNTIYIGTGDKDGGYTRSLGVLKSTDYGATWNTTGLTGSTQINKLIMHPTNNNILLAARADGLYKTTNGGTSWTKVLSGDIDDVEFKPGNPNTVYAITKSFYRSTNGGNSFSSVAISTSGRAQIAVTEANPNYVYFISQSGVFRSANSGSSFTKRGNYPGGNMQMSYDLACAASHVNAEELHIGEVETYASTNGGTSFTKTAAWSWGTSTNISDYVHADVHEMIFYGNTLYVGSDGLITRSNNAGNTWANLTNGIGIRQFYRIGGSKTVQNSIGGGSQDNGTSHYKNGIWYDWRGADGMEFVMDYNNNNTIYGTIQFGSFYKSNNGGTTSASIVQPGKGDWVTPYVMDPVNSSTLYVGNSVVKKTTNGMQTWSTIGAFGTGNITALEVANSNSNYIYASKVANLWRTSNGGGSWTQINSGLPNSRITYIAVHPSNPQVIAVSFSGYTAGSKVYISYNGGSTWTNYSGNLPNIPANCVTFYDSPDNELYVGMEVGIYYRNKNLTEWVDYTNGLPNVIIKELEIFYPSKKLRVATHGRGLWIGDLYTGQTGGATNLALNKPVTISSTEATGLEGSKAVDANGASRWASTYSDPQWISIDLQNTYAIDRVVLKWENASGKDFKIEVSPDGTSWTPIKTVVGNTSLTNDYTGLSGTGRYIRMYGTARTTSWGYSLYEFEVYGASPEAPVANFSANNTSVNIGQSVTFTDQSTGSPSSWSWTFSGGTPSTSTVQNPAITYNTAGTYQVQLTTENAGGSNGETKNAYITVNVPSDPVISQSGWTLHSVDSEETTGEDGAAANAFDGNTSTIWHTQWSGASPAYPHEIQINLGASYNITELRYLPRQNGTNTRIAGYEIYVSTDGSNWGTAVATGTWSDGTSDHPVQFTAKTGQYVRLVGLSAVNASNFAGAAEINVYGTVTEVPITYCASQGNNSTYEWISGVTIGSFTNTSGAANYTDFTSQTVPLTPGNNYAVSLTPSFLSSTYSESWKIYIDFNHNGDFSDAGEEFYIGTGTGTVSGNINIPSSATGQTRMRVSMKYNALQTSSCEAFPYGEVEDYTVSFVSGSGPAPAQSDNLIDFVADESISLFPNPSTGHVRLSQHTNVKGEINIQVFNSEGKLIHQKEIIKSENKTETDLDLQNLQSGMYYMLINSAGKSYTKKFIINK